MPFDPKLRLHYSPEGKLTKRLRSVGLDGEIWRMLHRRWYVLFYHGHPVLELGNDSLSGRSIEKIRRYFVDVRRGKFVKPIKDPFREKDKEDVIAEKVNVVGEMVGNSIFHDSIHEPNPVYFYGEEKK